LGFFADFLVWKEEFRGTGGIESGTKWGTVGEFVQRRASLFPG
jgi:hypothetical protein